MALIIKSGKTFINPKTGGLHTSAYLKVGQITYDNGNKICEFFLLTYNSQNDRINGKDPIYLNRYKASFQEFNSVFAPEILNGTPNIIAAVYGYLLTVRDERNDLIYSDWESDVPQ